MLKGNVRGWGEEGGKMAVWGGGASVYLWFSFRESPQVCTVWEGPSEESY